MLITNMQNESTMIWEYKIRWGSWYIFTSRCIWKLLQQVHLKIWAWSCILFVSTWISMTGTPEEKRSRIGNADRHWYEGLFQFLTVFGKSMGNVKKYSGIKFVTNNRRRCHLVSERNYHTTKWFSEKLLGNEMNKTEVKTNKLLHLGLYNIDSFIIYVKSEDVYEDLSGDVEQRFDTSN